MSIKNTQKFWRYWLKFKKIMRLVNDISSFVMLIFSFEKAIQLRTLSVVKTWQIARLAEKLPRLLRTIQTTFATI